jgi:hypothetical protein
MKLWSIILLFVKATKYNFARSETQMCRHCGTINSPFKVKKVWKWKTIQVYDTHCVHCRREF